MPLCCPHPPPNLLSNPTDPVMQPDFVYLLPCFSVLRCMWITWHLGENAESESLGLGCSPRLCISNLLQVTLRMLVHDHTLNKKVITKSQNMSLQIILEKRSKLSFTHFLMAHETTHTYWSKSSDAWEFSLWLEHVLYFWQPNHYCAHVWNRINSWGCSSHWP